MKRTGWILCAAVLALMLLLCGCDRQRKQITGNRPPWPGYAGTSLHYTYYYEDSRNLAWEEDVIFLADNYLDDFGALTPYNICIETPQGAVYTSELYDPQLRETFLAQINTLIPELQNMTDTQILYELQRIVALLGDLHTYVVIPTERYYPIIFEILYEDQQPHLYVTVLPEEYEDSAFARLDSVNGITLEKVLEKMAPYISHENPQSLLYSACAWLREPTMLRTIGVIENETDSVTYGLSTLDGYNDQITLDAMTNEEMGEMDFVGQSLSYAYPFMFQDYQTQNFWYEFLPEEEMFYVRINEFQHLDEYGIMELGNDMLREIRALGGVHKLVIDLRYNPGGYQGYGYDQFITVLQRIDADDIYVLINESTYSNGVITASLIKAALPDTILVGTPAGQPPNFYGSVYSEDYIMPNCGIEFRLPQAYWRTMPDYEYDALMPDITVYPDIWQYISSIDYTLTVVQKRP